VLKPLICTVYIFHYFVKTFQIHKKPFFAIDQTCGSLLAFYDWRVFAIGQNPSSFFDAEKITFKINSLRSALAFEFAQNLNGKAISELLMQTQSRFNQNFLKL